MPKTTVINVNRNTIASNLKHGKRDPVIRIQKGSAKQIYGHEAVIYDRNGHEVGRVIYSPDKPLKCGARLWIEIDPDCRVEPLDTFHKA